MIDALKSLIPDGANLKGEAFIMGDSISAFSELKKEGEGLVSDAKNIQNKGKTLVSDTKKETKELVSELTTTAGAVVSAVNVVSLSADQLSQIAQSMAAAAIGEITNFTSKKIAEFTTKSTTLATSIPGKIADKSIERFNSTDKSKGETKLSVGEILGNLAKNKEDRISEESEKTDEKIKTSKIDELKKSTSETLTKAKEFIQQANDEIYKVMEYAAEGPAYIAQQMSNKIESIQQNIEKTLNDQYKIVEDNINTFCEGEGNKIGEKLVQEYNNLIDKAAKATFEKTNNAKTQGIVKGTTAIQEAKLKLFALIGV